jgi:hypothetical protein
VSSRQWHRGMYLCVRMIVLLIVCGQESSDLRCCVVVACRCLSLALARYVAIACLGFPLLFRRSIIDVGLGWVGCCAAFVVFFQ